MARGLLICGTVLSAGAWAADAREHDPYTWLEEVEGKKALDWVTQQNAASTKQIEAYPLFGQFKQNALEVLNSDDRIAAVVQRGEYLYNLWRDETHVKGLYRRTTPAQYRQPKPKWETVLDLDRLSKDEKENWVYKDIVCLYPQQQLCMLSLSRGGADAVVQREFSLLSKSFVKDGFYLSEAKSEVSWFSRDQLLVSTDFGEQTMTDSGYPRMVKLWPRGTDLSKAVTLHTAAKTSVAAGAHTLSRPDGRVTLVYEYDTFFTSVSYVYQQQKLIKLALPKDASIGGYFNRQLFVQLKSDWDINGQVFKQGAVIYQHLDTLLAGKHAWQLLIQPSASVAVQGYWFTRNTVLLNTLDNVKSKLWSYQPEGNGWNKQEIALGANGVVRLMDHSDASDDVLLTFESFLQPDTLYRLNTLSHKKQQLKQLPAYFDSKGLVTEQYFATSKDGTRVPYFVVAGKDIKTDGNNPTLLYGYGGFEVSLTPYYSPTMGKNWLANGGVYVLSNIRGGGEYGPGWHQAALKKNRHKAYEDFEAIALDLFARKITSPRHLGIQGGSNGGLLMGAAFTRRPDLYNAVVCQVPLLDMKRYNHLLAGASWMGEYGDPDKPEMWQYIKTYSPYHNVKKEIEYPKVFFTTSTRDDRVHPGHARKMVARMKAMGHDVLYFENTEGGHAGAANNNQKAYISAMTYAYLMERLR